MQELDLYASIENSLPFEDEVQYLYKIFLDTIKPLNIKTLIDIGCGQGDFCKLVSKTNIDVLGVDLSKKQIEAAKLKGVKAQHINIKDIKNKFDCATAVFDVVNYLEKNYIDDFFQYVYNLLNHKGYFIFDINSLFGFEEVAVGTLNIDEKDRFIAIDAFFEDNILSTQITTFTKNKDCYNKQSAIIKQYYYSKHIIEKKLKKIGFKIKKIKNINLHNFDNNDKLLFITQKD